MWKINGIMHQKGWEIKMVVHWSKKLYILSRILIYQFNKVKYNKLTSGRKGGIAMETIVTIAFVIVAACAIVPSIIKIIKNKKK